MVHDAASQGSKYQKRWFELTEDTLAYAKDPNELKETNIEVFSMLELRWFKRLGEVKIEVRRAASLGASAGLAARAGGQEQAAKGAIPDSQAQEQQLGRAGSRGRRKSATRTQGPAAHARL